MNCHSLFFKLVPFCVLNTCWFLLGLPSMNCELFQWSGCVDVKPLYEGDREYEKSFFHVSRSYLLMKLQSTDLSTVGTE